MAQPEHHSILNTPTPIDRTSSRLKPSPSVHFSASQSPYIAPRRLFKPTGPPPPDPFSSPNSFLRYPIREPPTQAINWLQQEPLDQPKPKPKPSPPKSTPQTLIGHFPATPQHASTATTTTPVPQITSTRHAGSTPNSNIPISLNPHLATGIKLGQARLAERLRINLIALVLLYTITSTRTFATLITAINRRFPKLDTPIYLLEWILIFILLFNTIQAYYKLKTRRSTTHIDLPLTPQQIRGTPNKSFLKTNKPLTNSSSAPIIGSKSSTSSPADTHRRSSIPQPDPSPAPKNWSNIILSQDPLSQSTSHLFKRSSNLSKSLGSSSSTSLVNGFSNQRSYPPTAHLGQSVRKISNHSSLQKLLQEAIPS